MKQKRLNRWKAGILAFFKYRITNAVSEGIKKKSTSRLETLEKDFYISRKNAL
jgi:hypothetical protein